MPYVVARKANCNLELSMGMQLAVVVGCYLKCLKSHTKGSKQWRWLQ